LIKFIFNREAIAFKALMEAQVVAIVSDYGSIELEVIFNLEHGFFIQPLIDTSSVNKK